MQKYIIFPAVLATENAAKQTLKWLLTKYPLDVISINYTSNKTTKTLWANPPY